MDGRWLVMAIDIRLMKERLKVLEEKIRELEKRLPAHSVKPSMMAELCALEDDRDAIILLLTDGGKKEG